MNGDDVRDEQESAGEPDAPRQQPAAQADAPLEQQADAVPGGERSAAEERLEAALSQRDMNGVVALVEGRDGAALEEAQVRALLADPFVTREVLDALGRSTRLHRSHEIRRQLVAHRLMPEVHSLRLLQSLYWNALVAVGADVRVRPAVRRAADRRLVSRLPGLSVGEKLTIARRAGLGVMAALLKDPNRSVLEAVLANPRMTEGVLAPELRRDRASKLLLETAGTHARWSLRYPVRLAVCLHPATPVLVSLPLISFLRKPDLRLVVQDVRLPMAVRRRAELFLGR